MLPAQNVLNFNLRFPNQAGCSFGNFPYKFI